MKKKYRREMDYVYAVIKEMERKLEKPVRDLDDVRTIMDNLRRIREQEVDMELKIEPVEVSRSYISFKDISDCILYLRKPLTCYYVMKYR